MIEAGLVSFLLSQASVTAIVDDRIYPDLAEEGQPYPQIVYTLLTETDELMLDGPLNLPEVRLQLDIWGLAGAEGYKAVKLLAEALRPLHGYRGMMGDYFVQMAQLEQISDSGDSPQFGKSRGDSRVILDLLLVYEQAEHAVTFEG